MLELKAGMSQEEIKQGMNEAAFVGVSDRRKASMQAYAKQLRISNPNMSVKRIMQKTAKKYGVILTMFLLVLMVSCKKEHRDCPTYTVEQYCQPKSSNTGYISCGTVKTTFSTCVNHNPGDVEMYHEDQYVYFYRRYLRKL